MWDPLIMINKDHYMATAAKDSQATDGIDEVVYAEQVKVSIEAMESILKEIDLMIFRNKITGKAEMRLEEVAGGCSTGLLEFLMEETTVVDEFSTGRLKLAIENKIRKMVTILESLKKRKKRKKRRIC